MLTSSSPADAKYCGLPCVKDSTIYRSFIRINDTQHNDNLKLQHPLTKSRDLGTNQPQRPPAEQQAHRKAEETTSSTSPVSQATDAQQEVMQTTPAHEKLKPKAETQARHTSPNF